MAKVIAIFNQAGGVGKTTLTLNVGYELSRRNLRILMVDMDPQGSLTEFCGIETHTLNVAQTLLPSLTQDAPLPVISNIHGMSLVPANVSLANAERDLMDADMRDFRLKDALEGAEDDFDIILIDCQPSLSLLPYLALVAADGVLIPIQTQFKAYKGTNQLFNTLARVKKRPNKALKLLGFVPTMYAKSNSQDKRVLAAIENLQTKGIGPVLPAIPRATDFADSSEQRKPLRLYAPKHPALAPLEVIAAALDVKVAA